jgi:5'-nucleotidase/UDP-sugar diphosphatase
MPRLSRCLAAVLLAAALAAASPAAALADGPAGNLVILFTHDIHSHLAEYPAVGGDGITGRTGGLARMAAVVAAERRGREDRVLLLDAGDFSMGTLFHTIRSTRSAELVLMGELGYDATTFGNHDFDFTPDGLAAALRAARAAAPGRLPALVASNLVLPAGRPELDAFRAAIAEYPVTTYKVIERAGLRVGLFALMGKDAADDAPLAAPVTFADTAATAARMVDLLRNGEKADIVICLSHVGTNKDKNRSEDELLAAAVPGIDVIISGHTHTVLEQPILAGGTVIVSAGAYSRFLGRLEFTRSADNGFGVRDYRLIAIAPPAAEAEPAARMVAGFGQDIDRSYLAAFGYKTGQVLARSRFSLPAPDWSRGRPDAVLSGQGDLVTDAYRAAVRAVEGPRYREISLAVTPYGLIRAPLPAGPVTVDDAFRVLSLGIGLDGRAGYPLVTFWLTGREIRSLFEVEATLADVKEDARLQISGMRFAYDPGAPPFARVAAVEVETGDGSLEPLDDSRLYRVCTNLNGYYLRDFLARATGGRLTYQPKDEAGAPLADPRALIVRRAADPASPEVKEWLALAMYLGSFPDRDGDGRPDIPDGYRTPQPRIVPLAAP